MNAIDLWSAINWKKAIKEVLKLQQKIYAAAMANDIKKVIELQRILTNSFYARALAVKQVTSSAGGKTPGVDGVIYNTDESKILAVHALKSKDYKATPVKRIIIPKKKGGIRPLGIPTIFDRAIQALHVIALSPISEVKADVNSYGFRTGRSQHDAYQAISSAIATRYIKWILDADIKTFFDSISHAWIESNVIIDKEVLHEFLKAGFLELGKDISLVNPTNMGVPQGGVISPIISNIVLNGLENAISKVISQRVNLDSNSVIVVRYADDFVVLARAEFILNIVKPVIVAFLKERGLSLNNEKTKVLNLKKENLNFLGFKFEITTSNSRSVLITRPGQSNVEAVKAKIKAIYSSSNVSSSFIEVVLESNSLITGWCNYYRVINSSNLFSGLTKFLWEAQYAWAQNKFPHWNSRKIFIKCFTGPKHIFFALNDKRRLLAKYPTDFKIQYLKKREISNPYVKK